MNAANSGDAGKIIQLVSQTGTAGPETQTVSLSAEDLGLPAGGTVILTVTGGGVNFSGTAGADENGNVSFEVPKVETNKTVTIELSVLDANGTVLWYGSDTQQVKDGGNLSISLTRQYWTLTPGSIAVSATSYSLLYNASTWTSDSTELSVTGLENAPAGSTFSYEWKDESGTVLGTGPTLTQTVFELYGSPAGAGSVPSGDITKTITVTVTYTDASGATVSADASAEIALGGPVTLPAFSISIAAPASMDGSVGSSSSWALTNLTDGFTLTPVPGTGSFPAGTTFHWEIEATGGALITRTTGVGADCVVKPGAGGLGLDDSSIGTQASPTTISVRCTAKNDRADVDADAPDITQDAYLYYFIPAFTVTITPPAGYVAGKSDVTDPANPSYALTDATGAFSFTPVSSTGLFPSGTTFHWTVDAFSPLAPGPVSAELSADTTAGSPDASSPITGTGMLAASEVGYTPANAVSISITCEAHNPHALADRAGTGHASAFMLYTIPSFTISIDPPDSHNAANSDLTDPADPCYALTSLTDGFTLTAVPAAPATSFPDGTYFEWKFAGSPVTGVTDDHCTLLPSAMGVTSTTSKQFPKSKVIDCTAKNPNAVADVEAPYKNVRAFRLAIPSYKITVTAPDGIETETDSSGDTVYLVTNADLTTKQFTLTAEKKFSTDSIPIGTTFSWQFGDSAAAWTSAAAAASKTVDIKTMCGGITSAPTSKTSYTISCKAILDGAALPTGYPASVTVKLKRHPVLSVSVADLPATLEALAAAHEADDPAHPQKLNITGLNGSNWADMKTALQNCSSVYVDLSETTLPDGIDMNEGFYYCSCLVVPPAIPNDVTNMRFCFCGCTNLTTAPVIPAGVENMLDCFVGCTKLTTAPVIPASVTRMFGCFDGCTSLSGIITIHAGINDWEFTFRNVDASKITKIYVPGEGIKYWLLQENTQFSDAQVAYPVPPSP